MARPITLFTGQWADLPFEEVCRLASELGYDGIEIACWGDHFEVDKALADASYFERKRETLEKYDLKVCAISAHLVGQAVCDHPIDERHQGILPDRSGATASPRASGSGPPKRSRTPPGRRPSSASPSSASRVRRSGTRWPCSRRCPGDDRGRLRRTSPPAGTPSWTSSTRSASASPTRSTRREIAYDYWTTGAHRRHRPPPGVRPELGPVALRLAGPRPGQLSSFDFADRIYHVDCKDAKVRPATADGRLGSHLAWADLRRGWDFLSTGHGDVPWEDCFRALNSDRLRRPHLHRMGGPRDGPHGRRARALAFIRALTQIEPSTTRFDAAFGSD